MIGSMFSNFAKGARVSGVVLAFAVITLLVALAASASRADENGAELERLQIVTSTGSHPFLVEVMRTQAQRERGLMFRRSMPADRGMLFEFGVERPIDMWMRNTYLPLDMVFLSRGGRVAAVAENTEPLSERIISSRVPAYAVLELNAGAASRIGLKIGDSVRHPIFAK